MVKQESFNSAELFSESRNILINFMIGVCITLQK